MTTLSSWERVSVADGVVLVSPEGPDGGVIRVRPKAPLAPLAVVTRGVIAGLRPKLRPHARLGSPRRVTTNEGEPAVLVTLFASFGGMSPLERHIALIAGEWDCVRIDAACEAETRAAFIRQMIEELVRRHVSGRSRVRRRLFAYAPLKGWRGLRRPMATRWFPPRFPRDAASILVLDALPLGDAPTRRMADLLWGDSPVGGAGDEIRVKEGCFEYRFRLEGGPLAIAPYRRAFGQLVRSMEPIPAAAPQVHSAPNIFGYTS
jgi:hypothetical protein